MERHFYSLVGIFLVCVTATSTSGQVFYVTPSHNLSCPKQTCSTLSEPSTISNLTSNVANVILHFLPGHHILDRELVISDTDNISISMYTRSEGSIIIRCRNQGRFTISGATTVSMWGLHFLGCEGNIVTQVDYFWLQDITFQGLEGDTALILHEVSMVNIIASSFFNNTQGRTIQQFEIPLFVYILSRSNINTVGGAIIVLGSNVDVDNVMFEENSARFGAAIFVGKTSNVTITNSQFLYNNASNEGVGVVFVDQDCSLQVSNSTFRENVAGFGIISSYRSTVAIGNSSVLVSNSVLSNFYGGAVIAYNGSLFISDSIFSNNIGQSNGGAIIVFSGSCHIAGSIFSNNTAAIGGALFLSKDITRFCGPGDACDGSFYIVDSNFSNNTAEIGGGAIYSDGGSTYIANSTYSNNRAKNGGVAFTFMGSLHIVGSTFVNNTAEAAGGVLYLSGSLMIANSIFSGNKASLGGIAHTLDSQVTFVDCFFEKTMTSLVGSVYAFVTSINISGNTTFVNNYGSLYCFNCNITFSGYTTFEKCTESTDRVLEEGGAITSLLSNVMFADTSNLISNKGRNGGAILAIESTISVSGDTIIANNTATAEGGGLNLRQSTLKLKRAQLICFFSHNNATLGGGIHAIGSTVVVNQPSALLLENNIADMGGGIYLTGSSNINLLRYVNDDNIYAGLTFTGNHATTGGALLVDDNSNSGACTTRTRTSTAKCFIQSLSLDPVTETNDNLVVLYFSHNTATENGPSIFGGLLNICTQSQLAAGLNSTNSGVDHIKDISNVTLDSITSLPVQICYCTNQIQPNCDYEPPTIQVKKGGEFTISLMAIDQVGHPVEANITSFLDSNRGGFGEDQQIQNISKSCTNLKFNVFSPLDSEMIGLYAEGPCGNSERVVRYVHILFTNCTCPIGFIPSNSTTRCECMCDPKLDPHITECSPSNSSLLRMGTNSWITYVNDSDTAGYVIESVCPFDYCQPTTELVSINLNIPGGADAQCAYNRTGRLCGACQSNFSLSLGSSHCIRCERYWPAVLIVIILAAIIAGILLVAALLALNLTVAGGQINVFIFYANIVAASSSAYFPFPEPTFPSVFVAWLNLDIGFDVCFYEGLDAYVKFWLQLAFPTYIISLVILVIIVSEYSPRFANLIGKRDPVATLATLILLSYTKLLSTALLVYSYNSVYYPNGTRVVAWLPDGNVEYYEGKRIVFVILAFIIIFVGFVYTVLLFSWQWIIRAPRWRILRWIRNTKLNAFITTYHVPYNSKYRYWTGLLLVVRVIMYITAAFTTSVNPQAQLLATIVLVGGLLILMEITGKRVYKKLPTDIVETAMYFNLLAFASFSLYDFQIGYSTKQFAVSHVSTLITFALFVGTIYWNALVVIRNRKKSGALPTPDSLTTSKRLESTKVTFSSVAIPYRESSIIIDSTV